MRFPNETNEYRQARNALLQEEISLRRQVEHLAAGLRALPPGGQVPEDYQFEELDAVGKPVHVRMSQLFRGRNTLMIYHYMFPRHRKDLRAGPEGGTFAARPLEDGPCPSCTALIDSWDGAMPHFEGLGGNLVVVTRAPIEDAAAFAVERGWKHIRLISAADNSFRRDYGGDGEDGAPVPIMTVFVRDADGTIRLPWASELIGAPPDPGQDPRHLGMVEPIWTLFDLSPEGRPNADEQLSYACCAAARSAAGSPPPLQRSDPR